MSISTAEKVRENRLRRMAGRQRLQLHKAPRKDPLAWDYGTWQITDRNGRVVAQGSGDGYGLSLDEVEHWLTHKTGR